MSRKTLVVGLGFIMAAAMALSSPSPESRDAETGPFQVKLISSSERVAVGIFDLEVEVRDSAGRLLDDATVRLKIDMVDHSMGELSGKAVGLGAGRYGARVNLSMAGPWQLQVDVERGNESGRRSFRLSVL